MCVCVHDGRSSRSEARRIKAERANVPLQDFKEPRPETAYDVRERGRQFLKTLLKEAREARVLNSSSNGGRGEPVGQSNEEVRALIVSHGGFLYEMLANVLGLGEKVGLPSNCAVSIVEVHENEGYQERGDGEPQWSFVPRVINDFAHMVEAGLATANRVENLDVDEK